MHPSKPNSGITLINQQIPKKPIKIGTLISEPAMHSTVLKGDGWAISTTEHLLAAIAGLGIDNISVEIDGMIPSTAGSNLPNEIPILDGSALPFVQSIQKAGIVEQEEQKKFITPKKKLLFEDSDGRSIEITPARPDVQSKPILEFEYSVEFEHPLIKENNIKGKLSTDFFANEISPARTFGFLQQLPFLRKHGLAQGTTLGNTVVVGNNIFLNSRRFPDEFIRHKLLDLIGDLALLGKPLVGKIKAHKTGHNFNRKIVEHFLRNPEKWTIL